MLPPRPHRAEALSDDARLTSVCLSVAYIGSRTERPRKTKIGTEVAHVTRDSDTTSRSKVNLQGAGHIVAAPAQLVVIIIIILTLGSGIRLRAIPCGGGELTEYDLPTECLTAIACC